jgi:hypothetical protein
LTEFFNLFAFKVGALVGVNPLRYTIMYYEVIKESFSCCFSKLIPWIEQCGRCLRRKTPTNQRAPLVPIVTSSPIELVCMDFLTLEKSKGGYQHILVITDDNWWFLISSYR